MSLTLPTAAQRPLGRSFLIDVIKASGCLLIVLHHMAFYGPMSDVVATAWPAVMDWLYEHGRLAVQFFLVCAGFLTAGSLARFEELTLPEALKLAWQRYLRLAIPLLAALSFTVLVSEWLRPDFDHASLSATPEWGQALAHMVLLQHVLDMEALSAGIWYVAIDFQLYAMTLLSLMVVKACRSAHAVHSAWTLRWGLWLGLTCASLWGWNLHADLDDHGVYFFGSYGLGLLAWEARRHANVGMSRADLQRWTAWAALLVIGVVAWWLEPRWRIATAWGVACLLMGAPEAWFSGGGLRASWWRQAVQWLSTVSYSVFLIHFGVNLVVSAGVAAVWPDVLWANTLGMLVSLLLSVAGGALLYRLVERQSATLWRWWLWVSLFEASVALAMFMSPTV
ncbi:acyltransferase family protein [Limnohabitans parvus]|uniref:acyltransferase family protein n=1 Tax=Limnohabitans parvus TaxID=540061 RepID=UPI00142D8F02|nr:acyltransferase family protein [Limnohabitans parvus]